MKKLNKKSNVPETIHYWAFISYTSADKKWAEWVHRSIERYKIPRALRGEPTPANAEPAPLRLKPIFLDRAELKASSDLNKEVNLAICKARWLIVICSPNAAKADWVNKEIYAFRRQGGEDRILPIIVAGDPKANDDNQCFPSAFKNSPPLAADARKGQDGEQNAKLKLIAGMLGVSFDALKQRDAHRKILQLEGILAFVIILAVSIASLAWYANQQRVAAVQAQQQTVEHLEFMIFDLKSSLEPLGKLDILEDVIAKTKTFTESAAGTKDLRYLKSVACLNQGDIALTTGNTHLALEAFAQALSLRIKLLELNPADPNSQTAYAEALANIGRVQSARGEYASALTNQLKSIHIYKGLAGINSIEFKRKSAFAHEVASTTLRLAGNVAEARDLQANCVALLRSASLQAPDDLSVRRQLATDLDKLGDVVVNVKPEEAAEFYLEALKMRQELSAQHPDDLPLREELSRSFESFAAWYLKRGSTQNALDYYQKTIAIRERLVEQEPRNTTWQHLLAQTRSHLADTYISIEKMSTATSSYLICADTYGVLEKKDPHNVVWQECLVGAFEKLGDILKAQIGTDSAGETSRSDQVLSYYQKARAKRERLCQLDPQNRKWSLGLSVSDVRIGDWYYDRKDLDKALRAYLDCVNKREGLVADNILNRDWGYMLGVAYGKVGLAYKSKHDWVNADKYARKQLTISEQLILSNPNNALWLGECALAHYRLGNLYQESIADGVGNSAEAIEHLKRAKDLFMALKNRGLISPSSDRYLRRIEMLLGSK